MAWIKITPNEHGTDTSHHICDTCKTPFTITPAVKKGQGFDNCLTDDCDSYDPDCDIEPLFMTDEEISKEKKVVSMKVLQRRRNLRNQHHD